MINDKIIEKDSGVDKPNQNIIHFKCSDNR